MVAPLTTGRFQLDKKRIHWRRSLGLLLTRYVNYLSFIESLQFSGPMEDSVAGFAPLYKYKTAGSVHKGTFRDFMLGSHYWSNRTI